MRKFYVLFALFCNSAVFFAQPDLVMTPITSVSNAVGVTGAGDGSGRLFIVNEAGIIRIYDQNTSTLLPGNYLDISSSVQFSGEQGLLGLAFHPDFKNNGFFYVNYIASPSGNTRISRFTAASSTSNNTVNAASELILLTIDQPYSNHNGGDMHFGTDGYLYIAVGDGGNGGDPGDRAQNPQELLGKILRLDVDNPSNGNNYGIPPDNPFVGIQSPVDYRDEIWDLGVRNPWRFSFDRMTGDMYIADVGQGAWEEVNFEPANSSGGVNYGWRCYEGNHLYNSDQCLPMSSYTFPVFEYGHNANGGQSITGGFVYRGTDAPALNGWYVLTDYVSGNFWLLKNDGTNWVSDFQPSVGVSNITSFGQDDNGELYAARLSGAIYKVTSSPLPIELLRFQGTLKDEQVQLNWTTATEHNSSYFEVQRKTEQDDFQSIGQVNASGERISEQRYFFSDPHSAQGQNVYRLKMVDRDQSFEYSPLVAVQVLEAGDWQLTPNPASGSVSILMNKMDGEPTSIRITITDVQGKEVLSISESNPVFPYNKDLNIAHLNPGVYFCKLQVGASSELRRLVVR